MQSKELAAAESAVIPALTGLRFLAAGFVAYTHFNSGANLTVFGFSFSPAPIGMSLFFCLSGFIIHYVYGAALAARPGSAAVGFFVARVSRLYPLFLVVMMIGLLYYPALAAALTADPWRAVSYFTLTGTWWYWQHQGKMLIELPVGITWSISTEWFFYLIYALCLYPIVRIRSVRVCAVLLVALCAVAYAVLWTVYARWGDWEPLVLERLPSAIAWRADNANSFFRWLVGVSPYARLFEFLGGCLVCQIFLLLVRAPKRPRRDEAIFWSGAVWLVVTFGLYTYASQASAVVPLQVFAYICFLFAPGLLLMLLGLALGCRGSRVLALAWPVFLGEISYSIYLTHPFVAAFAWVSPQTEHPWIGLALDLCLACVVAFAFYRAIEMPAKLWLRQRARRARLIDHFPVAAALWPPLSQPTTPAQAQAIASEPRTAGVDLALPSEKFSDPAWRR
jgi:peptidoglycan/LPS O-acetylase OafA/YrhL